MSGKPPREDDDWIAAEAAFAAARQIQGPERFDALKKAGQLRYDAHKKQLAKLLEQDDPGLVKQHMKKGTSARQGEEPNGGAFGNDISGI